MNRGGGRRLRRAIAIALVAAFLPVATTGCFGNFELTRKVWHFNKRIDPDKWIREVVFVILVVIPIYPAATLLDAVIFNSFEFWTGRNPVLAKDGATRVVSDPSGARVTLTRIDADTLGVRVERPDGTGQELRLVRELGAVSAWDVEGQLLARVASVAGEPTLVGGALASGARPLADR
jgi:hypothetical protein